MRTILNLPDESAGEPEPYRVQPLTMPTDEPMIDIDDNAAIRELMDAQDPQGYHANS